MTIRLHRGDLPDLTRYTDSVAIDTETMGLHPHRDRLCVVQLSSGDGSADVVQIPRDYGKDAGDARNLKALLGEGYDAIFGKKTKNDAPVEEEATTAEATKTAKAKAAPKKKKSGKKK